MADKKISALTGATTPLAGTEVLPIVQSGATVKVAVSDLTAGRAISATSVTASTGNFVVGTSGQGVDFSATPGTGTSELLNDYEEGTFTPTWNGGTVTVNNSNYTKVGRQVTWVIDVTFGVSVTVANSQLTLPFTATGTWGGGAINYTDYSATASVSVDSAANRLLFRSAINGGNVNCIDVATKRFICVVSYFA